MHHGLGSLAVSTVFCVATSRSTTNGSTSKKTRSELDWLSIPKIGRTKSGWTIRYRSDSGFCPSFCGKRSACPNKACLVATDRSSHCLPT